MGQNVSATQGQPLFNIQGRPAEQDAVVQRQGQFTRVLKSQMCPCMESGQPDIFCNICNGKGYLYSYQKKITVVDEESPHGNPCENIVKPLFNPICDVNYVVAVSSQSQFAQGELTVSGFNDSEIYLDLEGKCLHKSQPIRVGYNYLHWDIVTETFKGNGEWVIKVPGTRFDDSSVVNLTSIPNFKQFFADIVRVDECNYAVKSFYKQWIVFDDGILGSPPGPSDDITITYAVSRPHICAMTGLNAMLLKEQGSAFLDGMEIGDAMFVTPSYLDVGEGDRLTLLATLRRRSELKLRTTGKDFDELLEFDVDEILGFIIDEDGVRYTKGDDFELDEFNLVRWIGNKPADQKKYSIVYNYFPTYIVYKELPLYIGHENKLWPKTFTAKKYSRVFIKQREDIINTEEVAPASGGSTENKFGFKDVDL